MACLPTLNIKKDPSLSVSCSYCKEYCRLLDIKIRKYYMSEFNISVLNLMALLIGFFVVKYLTESLYAKLIVRPNGRPPKDS